MHQQLRFYPLSTQTTGPATYHRQVLGLMENQKKSQKRTTRGSKRQSSPVPKSDEKFNQLPAPRGQRSSSPISDGSVSIFGPFVPTRESWLCIVPPLEILDSIDPIRARLSSSHYMQGAVAHISIFNEFVPKGELFAAFKILSASSALQLLCPFRV